MFIPARGEPRPASSVRWPGLGSIPARAGNPSAIRRFAMGPSPHARGTCRTPETAAGPSRTRGEPSWRPSFRLLSSGSIPARAGMDPSPNQNSIRTDVPAGARAPGTRGDPRRAGPSRAKGAPTKTAGVAEDGVSSPSDAGTPAVPELYAESSSPRPSSKAASRPDGQNGRPGPRSGRTGNPRKPSDARGGRGQSTWTHSWTNVVARLTNVPILGKRHRQKQPPFPYAPRAGPHQETGPHQTKPKRDPVLD